MTIFGGFTIGWFISELCGFISSCYELLFELGEFITILGGSSGIWFCIVDGSSWFGKLRESSPLLWSWWLLLWLEAFMIELAMDNDNGLWLWLPFYTIYWSC